MGFDIGGNLDQSSRGLGLAPVRASLGRVAVAVWLLPRCGIGAGSRCDGLNHAEALSCLTMWLSQASFGTGRSPKSD
jgi:hypothetical protein